MGTRDDREGRDVHEGQSDPAAESVLTFSPDPPEQDPNALTHVVGAAPVFDLQLDPGSTYDNSAVGGTMDPQDAGGLPGTRDFDPRTPPRTSDVTREASSADGPLLRVETPSGERGASWGEMETGGAPSVDSDEDVLRMPSDAVPVVDPIPAMQSHSWSAAYDVAVAREDAVARGNDAGTPAEDSAIDFEIADDDDMPSFEVDPAASLDVSGDSFPGDEEVAAFADATVAPPVGIPEVPSEALADPYETTRLGFELRAEGEPEPEPLDDDVVAVGVRPANPADSPTREVEAAPSEIPSNESGTPRPEASGDEEPESFAAMRAPSSDVTPAVSDVSTYQRGNTTPATAERVAVDGGALPGRAERPTRPSATAADPLAESGEMTYFRSGAYDAPTSASRRATPFGVDVVPPSISVPEVEGGLPDGEFTWTNQFDLFREEALKLGRAKRWRRLASVTAYAVVNAPYSQGGTRTAMLLDLARIYRDRLKDLDAAEEAFVAAIREEPENAEAIAFLHGRYSERGDFRAMYGLFFGAVASTWDPDDRRSWTERAAEIATARLNDPDAATAAWEQLWRLGDADDDVGRELARAYRVSGRWDALVAFLSESAAAASGPARRVILRELAEAELSGTGDATRAAAVLEQIQQDQPDDPLVFHQLARIYAATESWDALEAMAKGERADGSQRSRQHLVAATLWEAGQHARAAGVYREILDATPDDALSVERYQAYLEESSSFEELVGRLEARVDATQDDVTRAALLARAGALAQDELGDASRAASLLERQIAIAGADVDSLSRLATLYEQSGDDEGLLRALTGLRDASTQADSRLDVLRRLAEHAAHTLGDEETAEACWKEILSLDVNAMAAREALMALHARREDFESLHSALMRQIALTDDDSEALRLSRLAAENLDANFDDPERSIDAWWRVLDYAPTDSQALERLTTHYASLSDARRQIAALEERILVGADEHARTALALRVGSLWRDAGEAQAAAASYERVLHWDPTNALALEGLVAVYEESEQDARALGALDQALGGTSDPERQRELLERTIGQLAEDDHVGRWARLRRLHALLPGDETVLGALRDAATGGALWESYDAELRALQEQLAAGAERDAIVAERARVAEECLEDPVRAFVLLQSQHLGTIDDASLDTLRRLGSVTERHEDTLALLDAAAETREGAARLAILEARAELVDGAMGSPTRSFEEQRRLASTKSALDGLDDLKAAAATHGLWVNYVQVLHERMDRVASPAERSALHARVEEVARGPLEDASVAAAHALARFRIDRDDPAVLSRVLDDADASGEWMWMLPSLEAAALADLDEMTADRLAEVARLYAEKASSPRRAFSLYTLALAAAPASETLPDLLAALVDEVDGHAELAHALRRAAAMCGDPDRAVDLLRRTAALYEETLGQSDEAVDVHRRLLELRDDEARSLDVMIASHRERSQWHDLRDRLRRWVELHEDGPAAERIERWMEVGTVAERELGDLQGALDAYGEVLALDAGHEEARSRTDALVRAIDDPVQRIAFLRAELARAPQSGKAEIELNIAQLQLERANDVDAALETLEGLVEREGVLSAGYEPLADLYRREGRAEKRVELLLKRADALGSTDSKREVLRNALHAAISGADVTDALREKVYRALLAVEPDDIALHRQFAQVLRGSERFEELAALLEETASTVSDPAERYEVQMERARLLAHNLDQPAAAVETWTAVLEERPGDEAATLSIAFAALADGDVAAYVEHRRALVDSLPDDEAALVLCHLAEACDEAELSDRVADFYREARRRDQACEPAREALKGIGRRRKSLRPEAALLPEDGERDLSWRERSSALRERGDAVADTDLASAIGWYRRATSTDANDVAAWDALARALDRTSDDRAAYRARASALDASRRSSGITADTVEAEAERLLAIAGQTRAVGDEATYERVVRRIHAIAPGHAASALAVAELALDRGDADEARSLLDALIVERGDGLPDGLAADVHFVRGRALEASENPDEASIAYGRALEARPLHASALHARGRLLGAQGRTRSAIEHVVRALVVEGDPDTRASLYFELGVLWEDGLGDTDEAGACYEFARDAGLETRALMLRVFRHFQRTGALQEGLAVVDSLLESATDSSELATLWLARGEIYAAHEDRSEDAIEAFDMALSYDPDLNAARAALAGVLEQRGDWDGLLQILEAVAESDAGTEEERAGAFTRMARIAVGELGDPERGEEFLRASLEAAPTREAIQQLAAVLADTDPSGEERAELLARLVALGPPWFEHVQSIGEAALDADPELGWCLLSPALMIRTSDDDLKGRLREMRRDYERPPIRLLPEDAMAELLPAPLRALESVLADVDTAMCVGTTTLDAVDTEGVTDVSVHSNIGRTFASFVDAAGLAGCTLHRSPAIGDAVRIVNVEGAPAVVIRADVFQQLARAEIGFMLAFCAELARSGARGFMATPAAERAELIEAVLAVAGLVESDGDLAAAIESAVDEDTRAGWEQRLAPLVADEPLVASALATALERGLRTRALSAGLVAGADLFQAVRLVARMQATELERPGVFDDQRAFDEYLMLAPDLVDLVRYASTPGFAAAVRTAESV